MARPIVLSRSESAPGWARHLPDREVRADEPPAAELEGFDSVWIDAPLVRPFDLARRVHQEDSAIQIVVVAPAEDLGLHERTLLFTPGLGEVWLTSPDGVDAAMHERARELTATRRRYRGSQALLSQAVERLDGGRRTRTVVSDAYLAALLAVLPDPVLSIDDEGNVVSWSDGAERVLGLGRRQALGRPVAEVLDPIDPEALAALLEEGRAGAVRRELEFRAPDRRLIAQAVVAPVEAGGVRVRSVVLRDVTQEREALEKLHEMVALRSRFYAAMSHEIRTPINAIMGYNELLSTMPPDAEKRPLYLRRSQKAARHLLALVNDVLDLSKLESHALEVHPERVAVADLLMDTVATVEPLTREHRTQLDVACDEGPATLWADARRTQQVLMNLISNALKFGEGRPVTVSCLEVEGQAVLEVRDQGRGIAPGDLERIFEEFTQVAGTRGGTGLGLAISRRLAELMGGRLTVESTPGAGSTFRLWLPLSPA